MRYESSVTSISWIPSEAVTGSTRVAFDAGFTHYDEPPPAQVDDIRLKLLLEFKRAKFQFFDVEEHGRNLRGDRAEPARGSTPKRRKYRKEQDLE